MLLTFILIASDSEDGVFVNHDQSLSTASAESNAAHIEHPTATDYSSVAIYPPSSTSEDGVLVNESVNSSGSIESAPIKHVFEENGFKVTDLYLKHTSFWLASIKLEITNTRPSKQVHLIHLATPTAVICSIQDELTSLGWVISSHQIPIPALPSKSTILIISELSSPMMSAINDKQWQAIKDIISADHKILWVTTGSQLFVSKPDNALIHGLSRTMRAEDPLLRFVTLDVEFKGGDAAAGAISRILEDLDSGIALRENEYVERNEVIYISRIIPDVSKDDKVLESMDLHSSESPIELRCERVGTLDSLYWAEVSSQQPLLEEGMVDVEIVAAGLNFKVLSLPF